ncbi:hypothetical protein CBR_g17881 [Chara braunii]|uniref:Reverse transcriptase domain-containing protein n=1 Tax=Chara braunii TaxID=69332 RepID=A0A388KVU5_CHABU|nr:hypothetical protein CBR_g17881 [Chara braunii]|eukprot:GBG74167.1 hypothetical protein CBR_g17881 [Chara braunii]
MGICNTLATFQRAKNMTFQNFVNRTRLTQGIVNFCVIVYMDDILVYSDSFHGHGQHIEWTLGALRDAGFKIALEKSEFFLSEISFLGYVVTRGGLRPDLRKVDAVRDAPTPTSLTQIELKWTRDNEHHAVNEDVELLIIQAWKTEVERDLLGFVFGSVEAGHRQLIVGGLLILLTQLLDDLPIDVISHCDESPAPHILSRSLTPYLQWSACLEGDWDNRNYPSHGNHLNPGEIIDILFFDRGEPTSEEEEEVEGEEDESEGISEEDEYYSEHSEHELGAISEEEQKDEEEEASEEEEAEQTEPQREDPADAEQRRAEIAEGKRPLEQLVGTDFPIPDNLTRDPEPLTQEDEHRAAETSSAPSAPMRRQQMERGRVKFEGANMVSYVAQSKEIAKWLLRQQELKIKLQEGEEYVIMFKPWRPLQELKEIRLQEVETKFWVMALRVPLDAYYYLYSAVQGVFGEVLLMHAPEYDNSRPKLMNIKFDMAPDSREKVDDVSTIEAPTGERWKLEIATPYTDWCRSCGWYFHTEANYPRARQGEGVGTQGRRSGGHRARFSQHQQRQNRQESPPQEAAERTTANQQGRTPSGSQLQGAGWADQMASEGAQNWEREYRSGGLTSRSGGQIGFERDLGLLRQALNFGRDEGFQEDMRGPTGLFQPNYSRTVNAGAIEEGFSEGQGGNWMPMEQEGYGLGGGGDTERRSTRGDKPQFRSGSQQDNRGNLNQIHEETGKTEKKVGDLSRSSASSHSRVRWGSEWYERGASEHSKDDRSSMLSSTTSKNSGNERSKEVDPMAQLHDRRADTLQKSQAEKVQRRLVPLLCTMANNGAYFLALAQPDGSSLLPSIDVEKSPTPSDILNLTGMMYGQLVPIRLIPHSTMVSLIIESNARFYKLYFSLLDARIPPELADSLMQGGMRWVRLADL